MTGTPNGIFEWIWFIATQYADLFISGTIITLIIAVSGTILGFILGFMAIPHNSKCGDAQEFFRQTIQRIRTVASQLWQGTAPVKDF